MADDAGKNGKKHVLSVVGTKSAPARPPSDSAYSAPIHNGLTEKQEAWCQYVARDGMSYAAAYRTAYNTENMAPGTIYREAKLMMKNPKIATRVEEIVQEIKEENSAQTTTRAERVLKTLEEMMLTAKTDSGRLRAAELLGKTVGLYRDVQENVGGGASVSELEAQLDKLLKRNSS